MAMVLVDTSVWIDHLRSGEEPLVVLLNRQQVLTHPFVIGELACGNLANRQGLLKLLKQLPAAKKAADAEVLFLIETQKLMGKGIGYVDAHLLAATRLTSGATLWTRDKRLAQLATELGIAQA